MRRTTTAQLVLAASLLAAPAARTDTFSRGSVAVESRAYDPDGVEETEDFGVALVTRLEIKYRPGGLNLVLRGLARFDAVDSTRNVGALEDAYVGYSVDPLTLRVGSQILTWTTTEAFHPVDIVNSRNYDSDLENLEKLGEPMVELRLRFFQGAIAAYYMPMRIAPKLLPAESRLSFVPPGVELGDPIWLDREGAKSDALFEHQAAVQVTQTIGPVDVALHVVDHSDRQQPSFTIDSENGELRPVYHSVTQFGLTYVQVIGSLLVKLEAARRQMRQPDPVEAPDVTPLPSHEQAAVGFEYNWTTPGGDDATFVIEGQGVRADREVRRQLNLFQADVFFGYRHAFSDEQGREVVLGFITDIERPYEYLASVRYQQRLSDTWSISAIARRVRVLDVLFSQAQFTLTRNF